MGLRDFILQAIANFKPIQITTNIKSLSIGGRDYKVENGNIIFDAGGTEEKIPLKRDKFGLYRPVIEGVPFEGADENPGRNVKNLDVEGKVFTRSDIGSPQLELLKLDNGEVIRKFKPVLSNHNGGADLGALVAAGAMISVEDARKDFDLSVKLHVSFRTAYKARGAMIYNLFRSDILETEILKHLGKLAKVFKSAELANQFLLHWDSIVTKGYPSAYFVKHGDSQDDLFAELNWRFSQGERYVRVFSRTPTRNRDVIKWCGAYCDARRLRSSKPKEYGLGFSQAIRTMIYNKKGFSPEASGIK